MAGEKRSLVGCPVEMLEPLEQRGPCAHQNEGAASRVQTKPIALQGTNSQREVFFLKTRFYFFMKVRYTAVCLKKEITRVVRNKFPVSHSLGLTSQRQLFATLVAVSVGLWPPTSRSRVSF